VIAAHLEVEAGLLGARRVAYELARTGLLGHEGVAEVDHVSFYSQVAAIAPRALAG